MIWKENKVAMGHGVVVVSSGREGVMERDCHSPWFSPRKTVVDSSRLCFAFFVPDSL